MKILSLILIGFFLFFHSHCLASEEVLARVGDKTITKADLERIISYYPSNQQKRIQSTPMLKKEVLERYIQGIVISKIAISKGFDKQPKIKERLELMTNDFLANQFIQQEVIGKIDVSEAEAKEYFNKYKEEFIIPEMIKVRHILIRAEKNKPAQERKALRDKAEALLQRVKKGEDFAKLASEHSEDPRSKAKGGELDFFHRGMMAPEFEKAAFALKPGQISEIVESQFGYHIIKLEERKEAYQPSFDEIKDKVIAKARDRLKDSKKDEFIKRAYKEAGVEIKYDAIKN
ncbi:MAG: peptidylprolyl isomerase [Thermodesulfovibrionales bacterium]|nr:peptidylprolyl isomerase [Thermodesulfovibrionales bacterium]